MESRGLIFIPDISGYTKFVNETEINHSRMVMQELLEILIDSNQIGLELSEIEGDAILFYKLGVSPDMPEIYRQVEKMFCAFHRQLIMYDNRRFCQCRACLSAINLSLKIITHYGEFTGYNVKSYNKLIGKDIIVAHQLLKNDIEKHEYWLVTDSMISENPPELKQWMHWDSSTKQTEAGEIPFHYTQLGELKTELKPDPLPILEITDKVKVFSITEDFDTDIITLFHATGDFNYRHRWRAGVKEVEEINHFLPRIGMKCRCLMEDGEMMIYSSSYTYHPDHIEFSETDEQKINSSYYYLEKLDENKTRLRMDMYLRGNFFNKLQFDVFKKKKVEREMRQSFSNLKRLVKEIYLPPILSEPVD